MPSEVRYVCRRSAILLPLKHLSSNCIISTLFYCLAIAQFFIQVPSKVYIKNRPIVKLYNKVLIIINVWLLRSEKFHKQFNFSTKLHVFSYFRAHCVVDEVEVAMFEHFFFIQNKRCRTGTHIQFQVLSLIHI